MRKRGLGEQEVVSMRKRGLGEQDITLSSDGPKKAKREREDSPFRGRSGRQLGLCGERLNQTDPLPVRRSGRERKLMYSTFNHAEIQRQLLNQATLDALQDTSEDEMEPYEKILSPQRRDLRRHHSGRTLRSSSRMKLRSSDQVRKQWQEGEEEWEEDEEQVEKEAISKEGDDGVKEGHGDIEQTTNIERKDKKNGTESDEEEDEETSDQESENGEDTENSQMEDDGIRGYFLRKRRPVIYQYQPVIQVVDDNVGPKPRRGRPPRSFYNHPTSSHVYQPRRTCGDCTPSKRLRAAHQDSTTSCSDEDEARFQRRKTRSMQRARSQCLPMNFTPEDVGRGVLRDRVRAGASMADVDPMTIDRSITFESIGGLREHIRALKEMVVFPLLYPEVFDRFKINPPRGVLFHGPPGCGKTLIARALANECSKGGRQVAFFMRKGADCLSKWVGESERQLRLLFDQAYQMRPSIIFFDEIDGLAPVRSSRQDQIHSSIVSTLLALMDGVDSRGDIVIIGTTNRIDAIDPALRRPGRFDREFLFPLPSVKDRQNILMIHTKPWNPPLRPDFIAELAEHTGGYCGADLKALCTEAALLALRRLYPQVYTTSDKLVLDTSKINVAAVDFYNAIKKIVPTAQRCDVSVAVSLSPYVRPLLLQQFDTLLKMASFFFPVSWKMMSQAQQSVKAILKQQEEEYCGMEACITKALSLDHHRNSIRPITSLHCNGVAQLGSSLHNVCTVTAGVEGKKVSRKGLSSNCGPKSGSHSVHNCWEPVPLSVCTSSIPVSPINGCEANTRPNAPGLFMQTEDLEQIYCDVSEIVSPEAGSSILQVLAPQETDETRAGVSERSGPPSVLEGGTGDPCKSSQMAGVVASHHLTLSVHPHATPPLYRPRILLCGPAGMGQTSHLGPALLHVIEDYPVKVLDLPTLYGSSSKSPEEACTQVFREARKLAPSVIYVPCIGAFWEATTDTFKATFQALVHSLPPPSPVLLMATCEHPSTELPDGLRELFTGPGEAIFTVIRPTDGERKLFFYQVLRKMLEPPPPKPILVAEAPLEKLPVAPDPVERNLSQEELARLEKQRHAVMRELRMFLRDATNKLIAERKFKDFINPVDPVEVPDYYEIIQQPMDLGTVMKKIDEHRYTTSKQWVADIDLITRNALEYNPETDTESRLLRHRALALQDMAQSILDHELSEDFEKQCEEVLALYQERAKLLAEQASKRDENGSSPVDMAKGDVENGLLDSPTNFKSPSEASCTSSIPLYGSCDSHRDDCSEKGMAVSQLTVGKKKGLEINLNKKSLVYQKCQQEHSLSMSVPDNESDNSMEEEDVCGKDVDERPEENALPYMYAGDGTQTLVMDQKRLVALLSAAVSATEQSNVEQVQQLYSIFEHLIFRSRFKSDRTRLLEELAEAIELFKKP